MTAIWHRDGGVWGILSPQDYPDEKTLHDLIEEAPQLLPLAGSPRLAIVGREVSLAGGTADLVGVEDNGRLVIIEIKLRRNPEARRAVVAQVLTYAASLKSQTLESAQDTLLKGHLSKRGFGTLAEAAKGLDQEGAFDTDSFEVALRSSLATGAFRLVVVLDAAPQELARLTSFLESVSERLTVDLIAVSRYVIGGAEVLVPLRVDAGREGEHAAAASGLKAKAAVVEGASAFMDATVGVKGAQREANDRMVKWAKGLEAGDLCRLYSYRSAYPGQSTLLPRLLDEDVGLVTIWGSGGFGPWRSVFERRAKLALRELDDRLPGKIGNGTAIEPTDEILQIVRGAYQEAAGRTTKTRSSV